MYGVHAACQVRKCDRRKGCQPWVGEYLGNLIWGGESLKSSNITHTHRYTLLDVNDKHFA